MKVNKLLKIRGKNKFSRKIFEIIVEKKGLSIPVTVEIDKSVNFVHNAYGTVIHPRTIIHKNVKIYQGVTLGRADIYNDITKSKMDCIIVEEGAIICAGAKVLCKSGKLIVGKNTVVGANSVLTCSTGENEIWGGIPAKKIGERGFEK